MRIKDLATRATKLLTGNAYMVFDNGTKVEKVDYAELAKQIITEYNTQTLAGSTQSVKAALDVLNSKLLKQLGANLSDEAFDALTADGLYVGYIPTTSCPCKQQWAYINVKSLSANANDVIQEVIGIASAIVCTRMKNNGTWGNWVLVPYFRESGGNAILDYIGSGNAQRHFTISDSGMILYNSQWNILGKYSQTTWKLAGTATGNNELSLTSATDWNELRVIVYLTSTPNEGRVGYNITRQEIADTTGAPFYVNGRFPSSGGQAQIVVSGTYVRLDTYMVGTTNRVDDATIRVYYR